MRTIDLDAVTKKVAELFLDACTSVPPQVIKKIEQSNADEASALGRDVLSRIIENDVYAQEKRLPLCQDTGIAVVFLTIGSEVIFHGDIYEAVNAGVKLAYEKGYFRKSVVRHPLDRVNSRDNTPAIVHVKIVPGDMFKIDVEPKGAGSENMSAIKMLIPADGIEGVKKFVLDTVVSAGGKPCPPIIVGVGVGGDFESCALLAKEALLRDIDDKNSDPIAASLEDELKTLINNTGIGPMGFGGTVTCLAVKVNCSPCHIASLPVAVNIQCHVARHSSGTL